MVGLTFSSKLDCGSYIISIVKTATKKIGALIHSRKFLSPELAQYLYKSSHAWNTVAMCGLVLLVAIWNCQINYKYRYLGLYVLHMYVLHLLPLLNPWLIIEMQPGEVFSIGITLVDVHLNQLNWFHFLILEGGLLIILIDCMIFLSSFLDVTRMCMSRVSLLAKLDSGILYLQNDYL